MQVCAGMNAQESKILSAFHPEVRMSALHLIAGDDCLVKANEVL